MFSVLPPRVVEALYEQFIDEDCSHAAVLADPAGVVRGYSTATVKPGFHRRFVRRHPIALVWGIVSSYVASPTVRRVVWANARGKGKVKVDLSTVGGHRVEGPVPVLMPIAVLPGFRRRGSAAKLVT